MIGKRERMDQLRAEADAIRDAVCAPAVRLVWGEGDLDAPLMIVGEAPGTEEDRLGRPFVGVSGKFLDSEFAIVGLSRELVYITGAVKCRPTIVRDGRMHNRAPNAAEIAAWRDVLVRQVEIIAPRVILCVGSLAANGLIHPAFTMAEQRGEWFEGPFGTRAMATYHPAYIHRWKRSPESLEHRQFREDLRSAREAAFGDE